MVDRAPALRAGNQAHLGFVFQYHYLLDEFTCLENALLPILIRRGSISRAERDYVIGLLKRVNLSHRLHNTSDSMSGGENQRCAIVRALANRPRLILADEPTGNLDSRSGAEVFTLLREINQETGVSVVMVTHEDRRAAPQTTSCSSRTDISVHLPARNRRRERVRSPLFCKQDSPPSLQIVLLESVC